MRFTPGEDLAPLDRAWLAGLLEGEGSFMASSPSRKNKPVVSIEMVDVDVIDRAAALMGVARVSLKNRREGWRPTFTARATGSRAVWLMGQLRPLMGERRQAQIDAALASYSPIRPGPSPENREAIMARFRAGDSIRTVKKDFRHGSRTLGALRREALGLQVRTTSV